MSYVCTGMLMTAIGPITEEIRSLIRPDHYLHNSNRRGLHFESDLRTVLRAGMGEPVFQIDGRSVDEFGLALNTAIVAGSDPVRLLVRLHGQCEIWAWVDGPHRAWMAGLIEQGLSMGVMRRHVQDGWSIGWEKVVDLLRVSSDSPVVTSYSVTNDFPAEELVPEIHEDAWWDLPYAERWDLAMAVLRAESESDPASSREMRPDHWASYRFRPGLTGFDIRDRF